jgi:glyoxylase-like metal-dependent hydrolase (beta-lactamase superfamily II)
MSIVNAYFVGAAGARDRGWVLIDAGLPLSANIFRRAAALRFGAGSRPAAIILTHGHFDHVGALPELADAWQVPIYCHPLELPYLTGRSSYPPPDPTVGGVMGFMSRFFSRGPLNLGSRVHCLPEDRSVPGAPGWTWLETPGHSPGHVSLFRQSDRVLIAGDAFVTVAQESICSILFQPAAVHRPPPYFTPDWILARASVERLRALHPRVAATGHGPPMDGAELANGLDLLLENWETAAVPHGSRYGKLAAQMDCEGTRWIPPRVPDRRLEIVIAGVAVIAAWLLIEEQRPKYGRSLLEKEQ